LDVALERKLPGFGICFGHQLLGYHLGQRVSTDTTRAELGTVRLTLTEKGRKDPLFSQLDVDFMAQTGHSDYVHAAPSGVTVLAENDKVATQAFKVDDSPFYSTQFHPDMTGAEAITRYLAYQRDLDSAQGVESASGVSERVTLFRAGTDAATFLLGAFLELIPK